MQEFVFVIPKKIQQKSIDSNQIKDLHGFLLEPKHVYTKKIGNLFGFYSTTAPWDRSFLFDGEAVYRKNFIASFTEIPEGLGTSQDSSDFRDNARGSYVFVKLNEDGSIHAFNDQLGNYPLFYLDNGDFSGLTNNLLLLESYLACVFDYALPRHSEHLVNEILFTAPMNVASFQGTFFVPFDQEISIDPKGVIKISERRGSDYFFNSELSKQDLLELSVSDIRENVQAIAESKYAIKIADVTGGMDSRMVLAAILGSGYKDYFFFNTNGSYPNPDANVSNYLIDKYGLKKARIKNVSNLSNNHQAKDFVSRFNYFCYYSAGLKNNLDREPVSLAKNNNIIKLGGGNSEFYKGFYSKLLPRNGVNASLNQITDLMFYQSSVIDDETRREKWNFLNKMFSQWSLEGLSYESVVDRFYIDHRGRFHNGVCEHWSRASVPKSHPLYSANTIRLAFSRPAEERINGNITFNLMNALYSPILYEPFEKRVWSKNAYKDHSDSKVFERIQPIVQKTKKLVARDPAVLEFTIATIKNILAEENNFLSTAHELSDESLWCKKQRALGRKWHWYTLDKVQEKLRLLLNEYNFQITSLDMHRIKSISEKKLEEFKSIAEVLEVHQLCLHLIFLMKGEQKKVISADESIIKFMGVR